MVTIAFFDRMVAHFWTLAEVLTNQMRKFFEDFEALYTKVLIDYYTTSRNHHNIDGLIE